MKRVETHSGPAAAPAGGGLAPLQTPPRPGRVLAVTSGKGGVGKTFVSANLAAALARQGIRVLVVDADLGLANLHVLLNLQPTVTLHEVLHQGVPLPHAVVAAPQGFWVLPAGSGLVEYSRLTGPLQHRLQALMEQAQAAFDVVLLDTGAGISDVVLHTLSLAREVLVVTTPDPTAMTDAYATIKVMATLQQRLQPMVLVNQVGQPGEGLKVARQLQGVVDRYLGPLMAQVPQIQMIGELPQDEAVVLAVRSRSLVLQMAPGAVVSRGLVAIAQRLAQRLGCNPGYGQLT